MFYVENYFEFPGRRRTERKQSVNLSHFKVECSAGLLFVEGFGTISVGIESTKFLQT